MTQHPEVSHLSARAKKIIDHLVGTNLRLLSAFRISELQNEELVREVSNALYRNIDTGKWERNDIV